MKDTNIGKNENGNKTIDIYELIFKYLVYWKWFILSFILCFILAFLWLRKTMPVYNVSSVIMINDEKKGGNLPNELMLFESANFLGNANTDNEVEVLKSKSLIRNVVQELSLYVSYIGNGCLKSTDLYDRSPIIADVSLFRQSDIVFPFHVKIDASDSTNVSVTLKDGNRELLSKVFSQFPIVLSTPYGELSLMRNNKVSLDEFSEIDINISKPIAVAKMYLKNLTVAPASKTSSVVVLSLKTTSPQKGENFLNKLIELYNKKAVEDKNLIAFNTAKFIEERIGVLGKELGNTERNLESYKKKEGITELTANASLFLQESSEYERKRVENETQLNLIRFLREYIENPQNKETVVPANIGLTDAGLLVQINKYNELLLERNRLLHATSGNNPVVINHNLLISSLFENIKALTKNIEEGLSITAEDLDKQAEKFKKRIGNVPTQERLFVEIDRQRQIQSSLFLMLLQKREENALAMAATTNKAKIIDETLADNNPVAPKKLMIWLIAFVLSVAIPIAFIYLKDLLNVRFSSKAEIERQRLTDLPIIAEIPLLNETQENNFNVVQEAFHLLRTNVRFMLDDPDKKIILVTSSVSKEGKSFVSVNLARNFAMLGKKVLLIGMDIRNPQLGNYFPFLEENKGLTNFLSGAILKIEDIIQKVPEFQDLYIISGGPVPPNAADLLSKEILNIAIQEMRRKFDYIIIDSAPVGVVSDTLIFGHLADITMFVCRAHYTYKKNFELLEKLKDENRLPNICVLVNGVKILNMKHYGYVYGGYSCGGGGGY